ncbi:histidine phosphatase family protein [uncultured Tistrella sp.]|uniref:histidine phosphatase family protein n=1 Tax=Tistrella mobilis TaxID=171437 RepID=UPI000C0A19FF|nr:histidine phosphatase family protein [uncultured Tistrella sp.]MAM75582.1 histidine phosphatase family protein [Tistrella sp.]
MAPSHFPGAGPALPALASVDRLIFLRHGRTAFNAEGRVAGQSDIPLDETGRAEAWAAIEPVRALGPDAIAASPMQRARSTAAIIAEGLGMTDVVQLVPGLRERNWGMYEGAPLGDRPPYEETPPGGEPWAAFLDRTAHALAGALRMMGSPRRPLIVAHSGTSLALSKLLDAPMPVEKAQNAVPLVFQRARDGSWRCWIPGS